MPLRACVTRTRILAACLVLAALALPLRQGAYAESLLVRRDGDRLRVSAPRLHFLAGKPLDRLRNGSSVAFNTQLALLKDRGGAVAERTVGRCVFSYDLWEEKFSVSALASPPRSISHLSSTAAETWCLEGLSLPSGGLTRDQPFWLRLELRAEDAKDRPGVVGESGINLARLIELFSRPSRAQQQTWLVEDGPFRLADLK